MKSHLIVRAGFSPQRQPATACALLLVCTTLLAYLSTPALCQPLDDPSAALRPLAALNRPVVIATPGVTSSAEVDTTTGQLVFRTELSSSPISTTDEADADDADAEKSEDLSSADAPSADVAVPQPAPPPATPPPAATAGREVLRLTRRPAPSTFFPRPAFFSPQLNARPPAELPAAFSAAAFPPSLVPNYLLPTAEEQGFGSSSNMIRETPRSISSDSPSSAIPDVLHQLWGGSSLFPSFLDDSAADGRRSSVEDAGGRSSPSVDGAIAAAGRAGSGGNVNFNVYVSRDDLLAAASGGASTEEADEEGGEEVSKEAVVEVREGGGRSRHHQPNHDDVEEVHNGHDHRGAGSRRLGPSGGGERRLDDDESLEEEVERRSTTGPSLTLLISPDGSESELEESVTTAAEGDSSEGGGSSSEEDDDERSARQRDVAAAPLRPVAGGVDADMVRDALRDATRQSTSSTIRELTSVLSQLRGGGPVGGIPARSPVGSGPSSAVNASGDDDENDAADGTPLSAWDIGTWSPAEVPAGRNEDGETVVSADAALQEIRELLEQALRSQEQQSDRAGGRQASGRPTHGGQHNALHPDANGGKSSATAASSTGRWSAPSFQTVYEECRSHGQSSEAYMRACIEYSTPLTRHDEAIYNECIMENIEFARFMGRRPDWEEINACLEDAAWRDNGRSSSSQRQSQSQRSSSVASPVAAAPIAVPSSGSLVTLHINTGAPSAPSSPQPAPQPQTQPQEEDDEEQGQEGWRQSQGQAQSDDPTAPSVVFVSPPAPPTPIDQFYRSLDDSIRELYCYDRDLGQTFCY